MFRHALSLVGGDPATTLFVGDNPDADIIGALSLGIQTAWMHLGREWPHPQSPPHHLLGHVAEVRGIVLD